MTTLANSRDAAPWGVQTREPTHIFSEDLRRSVPRKPGSRTGACTDDKCPHCTYLHFDDNGYATRRRHGSGVVLPFAIL